MSESKCSQNGVMWQFVQCVRGCGFCGDSVRTLAPNAVSADRRSRPRSARTGACVSPWSRGMDQRARTPGCEDRHGADRLEFDVVEPCADDSSSPSRVSPRLSKVPRPLRMSRALRDSHVCDPEAPRMELPKRTPSVRGQRPRWPRPRPCGERTGKTVDYASQCAESKGPSRGRALQTSASTVVMSRRSRR